MSYAPGRQELVFDANLEADGGYCAECLTESIVPQGNTWDELRANVREAVRGYYFDQPEKLAVSIRLHLVRMRCSFDECMPFVPGSPIGDLLKRNCRYYIRFCPPTFHP